MSRDRQSIFRMWADALRDASATQARWEIENSRLILARRKRWLFVLALPILLYFPLQALGADFLPDKIPVLGGSKALMPALVEPRMFYGSILVGLIAGLITGVIGAGGGYILTPALMSFGVRGIMAVGTDQFHLFAKAIMGTSLHRKMGNVNFSLAAWFVAGSLGGVTLGGSIQRAVFNKSPALSDALISFTYIVVLGLLGAYAIVDWIRQSRRRAASADAPVTEATTSFARWLQRLPLRPRIRFDHDVVAGGRSVSIYPVIVCGFIVGFVAAIMGVGGGFLTFPMFVYGLGVSTFTTVGTDILQIIFTTSYSSIFQYAIYGFVFYTVCVGMLLGSLIGVQIGAMVTKVVTGAQIRAFYALTILAGFANRACALPRKLADMGYLSMSRSVTGPIENAGNIIFFAIVGLFALWILTVFCRRIRYFRGDSAAARLPLIVSPRHFRIGMAGLVSFFVVLALLLSPVFNGQTGLQRADLLFNQLAKHSAIRPLDHDRLASRFDGRQIDIGISPRDQVDPDRLVRFMSMHGVSASITSDKRIRLTGDLGRMSRKALDDADLGFADSDATFRDKHSIGTHEGLYYWWIIYDGLTRRFVQENRSDEVEFCKSIAGKELEPAYNFRGIQPHPASENVGWIVGLLGFYVVYTLWYGFSILAVFEGMGISVSKNSAKNEA